MAIAGILALLMGSMACESWLTTGLSWVAMVEELIGPFCSRALLVCGAEVPDK
jgi:hypothetical protein